jgi:two-component system, chemotaxis family, protein-glutamate methylesterase/glutaminase
MANRPVSPVSHGLPKDFVAIGASAGGLRALSDLLQRLPATLPAILTVVMHRSPWHESQLAEVLARRSHWSVVEPTNGQLPQHGRVYLAPRDRHLLVQEGRFHLPRSAKVHFTRPAIDPLFESAAVEYGERAIGVLLSGGGHDGLSGLIAIKEAGGTALVQDPGEAEFPWMPAHAIWFDHPDAALPVARIADRIVDLTGAARSRSIIDGNERVG